MDLPYGASYEWRLQQSRFIAEEGEYNIWRMDFNQGISLLVIYRQSEKQRAQYKNKTNIQGNILINTGEIVDTLDGIDGVEDLLDKGLSKIFEQF